MAVWPNGTNYPGNVWHELLSDRVDVSADCWLWTAGLNDSGYGRITVDGIRRRAHCVSFELAQGPIPDGLVVDHKCHNPACVRPEHLHAVTPKQNIENRAGANINSKSGIRGVSWDRVNGTWRATVCHAGRSYSVGRFARIEDAERAVIKKRNELFTNNLLDREMEAA